MTSHPLILALLLGMISTGALACAAALTTPSSGSLSGRIAQVMQRPEYRHATFGIEIYSINRGKPIFELNAQKMFVAASTTKLLTMGTALELLGPDHRFRTGVYRTGAILDDGTLDGDLVLVASGDPNLSNRVRPDDTLAFENVDHANSSPESRAVPGDPLQVIRKLAEQIASRHIKKIRGRVRVDVSLFPEGDREKGTGVVISPVVVNDNLIDLTLAPGNAVGSPAILTPSPATSYVRFINQTTTGRTGSELTLDDSSDVTESDGSHTVTLTGSIPAGGAPRLFGYRVVEPSVLAERVLVEALREKGIEVTMGPREKGTDFKALSTSYTPGNLVAEHVSAPLHEEAKVTLKVSQNLHASMMPFTLGAVLGHKNKDIDSAGFALEREFLTKSGLDIAAAAQADGAGGTGYFTPHFMVQFLLAMKKTKSYPFFRDALAVLGREGTLFDIQTKSPAAGKVHAKTGTLVMDNPLGGGSLLVSKALAGYLTTRADEEVAFAIYVNHVQLSSKDTPHKIGEALGEIVTAAYEASHDD